MREIAEGVVQLWGAGRDAINQYVLGDVLVDAGVPPSARRILRALEGRHVTAHAITHAHPDHFGASAKVCERLGIPLWVGEADAETVQTGRMPHRPGLAGALLGRLPDPPAHPVSRRLREGDEVAGFRVLDVPGHSPGHIALWRESDRVLVAGDVLFNRGVLDPRPGLREPPRVLTYDPERNRASIRRLAGLEPALVLFGHGPPLRDPAALSALAASLG